MLWVTRQPADTVTAMVAEEKVTVEAKIVAESGEEAAHYLLQHLFKGQEQASSV